MDSRGVVTVDICAVVVLQGPYLPGYTATPDEPQICYGVQRLDHAVGNVPKLIEQVEHIMGFTGERQGCVACPHLIRCTSLNYMTTWRWGRRVSRLVVDRLASFCLHAATDAYPLHTSVTGVFKVVYLLFRATFLVSAY